MGKYFLKRKKRHQNIINSCRFPHSESSPIWPQFNSTSGWKSLMLDGSDGTRAQGDVYGERCDLWEKVVLKHTHFLWKRSQMKMHFPFHFTSLWIPPKSLTPSLISPPRFTAMLSQRKNRWRILCQKRESLPKKKRVQIVFPTFSNSIIFSLAIAVAVTCAGAIALGILLRLKKKTMKVQPEFKLNA